MPEAENHIPRLAWSGRAVAVQPRIRLMRSFDERHHSYQGYVLRIDGTCGDHTGEFLIAVGKGAHEKHRFCVGMDLSGFSIPVDDPRLEAARFYKTSGIKICKEAESGTFGTPPFLGVPPGLETYRSKGHRRLDTRTYETKCTTCIWGCRMPVEMIIDHWNPSQKRYTGSRPSATGRKVVPSTAQGQRARCPGEKACLTPKKTGLTRTLPRTVSRTIKMTGDRNLRQTQMTCDVRSKLRGETAASDLERALDYRPPSLLQV